MHDAILVSVWLSGTSDCTRIVELAFLRVQSFTEKKQLYHVSIIWCGKVSHGKNWKKIELLLLVTEHNIL